MVSPEMTTKRTTILLGAVFLGVALLAYLPALGSGFLAWDDGDMVLGNEAVTGAPLPGLVRIWTEPVFLTYLPATFTSLWLDHLLFGKAALGYHLVNVLFHALSALALVALLLCITRDRALSLTAGFLFLAHPLATESVIWISERKGLLAFLFSTLSMLWFMKAVEGEATARFRRHAVGTLFLVLALLSKGSALVVPLLLLLLLLSRRGPGRLRDLLPYGLAALLLTALHYGIALREGPAIAGGAGSTVARLLAGPCVLARYFRLLLVPVGQSLVPDVKPVAPSLPALLAGLAVVGVLAAALLLAWRRNRTVFLGLAFAVASLLPFNNVFPKTTVLFAERYAYFSIAGIALTGAALLSSPRGRRRAVAGAVVVLLLLLTGLRAAEWGDGVEVFRDARRKNGGSWLAAMKLGDALDLAGRHRQAAEAFAAAGGKTDRGEEVLRAGLSRLNALIAAGEDAEVVLEGVSPLRRFLPDVPPDRRGKMEWDLESKRGWALSALDRWKEAAEAYRAAARAQPDLALSFVNLCSSLARSGHLEEALEAGKEALERDPESEDAVVAYAEALVVAGRVEDAWRALDRYLNDHPDRLRALCLGGELDLTLTRPRAARRRFESALALAPGHPRAIRGLAESDLLAARAAFSLGQTEKARELARRAVARDPENAGAYVFLASMATDAEETDRLLSKAVFLPGGAPARNALAAHRLRTADRQDRDGDRTAAARAAAAALRVGADRLRGMEGIEVSGMLPRLTVLANGEETGRDDVLVGVVRFLAGRYAEAESILGQAYAAAVAAGRGGSDGAGLALLFRARSRTALKKFSSALDDLSVVAGLWPEDPWPFYYRSDAFLRAALAREEEKDPEGRPGVLFEGARSAVRRALEIDPGHLPSRLRQGEIEFAAGRYVDALRIFDEVKRSDPRAVEPMLRLATLYRAHYLITGDKTYLREAVEEMKQAVALMPRNARVRALDGEILLLAGDARRGADELRMAIAADPGLLEARRSLARLLAGEARRRLDEGGRENREKAKGLAERAIALHARIAGPHLVLADLYRMEKDFAPALEQLQWAKVAEPDIAEVRDALARYHKDLGYAYLLKGRKKDALVEFEAAVRAASKNVDLSQVRILLGYDEPEAEGTPLDPAVARLLAEKTEEARAAFEKGAVLHSRGDLEGAAGAFLESIKARSSAEAWVEIGRIRVEQDRLEAAEKAFGAAARLKPALPEAHLGLGNVRYARDDLKGALAAYRDFLRSSADRKETETRVRVQAIVATIERRLGERR